MTERIFRETGGAAQEMELIRAKGGVYVYRCLYAGQRAVIKYFENESDRREIGNYRMLAEMNVPTVKMLSSAEQYIVLEDIGASDTWRMGEEEDMQDPAVLRALARWYFALHEGCEGHGRLKKMWSETDELSESSIGMIRRRLPGAEAVCEFAGAHLKALCSMLTELENTVTYNDFYYTNFIVRRDRSAAMMFDYNLMGRGYRYADFRNIASSVSGEAFAAFEEEYAALHRRKHGAGFEPDKTEKQLDDFLSPLLGFVSALKREKFPSWAEGLKEDAENGTLLERGREIFK